MFGLGAGEAERGGWSRDVSDSPGCTGLENGGKSPRPALAPPLPRVSPRPRDAEGRQGAGPRASPQQLRPSAGEGEGVESQQGLWRSCVAELGVEGRRPCYSLTPPFYLWEKVLRPAAELTAPAGEGKEKPAKEGEGGALREGMREAEREAGRGGGVRERRSAARARVAGARRGPGAKEGRAQPLAPRRLLPSPSGGAKLWLWLIVFPAAASPGLLPRPKPILIARRLRGRLPGFALRAPGGPKPPWRSAADPPSACPRF